MLFSFRLSVLLVLGALAGYRACAQDLAALELLNVSAKQVVYRGVPAVELRQVLNGKKAGYNTLAIVAPADFQDGTIELELACALLPGAPELGSGFLGVAFRVRPGAAAFEMFHLRPNNARAADQLRRNHATQYISVPDWSWERTRQETPGLYESYVDLEVGAWTKMKIVVAGATAQLFINGAAQPCLVVNDLKLGASPGAIALWVGSGGEAYFANLRVTRAAENL
jgi:hypothetical protein